MSKEITYCIPGAVGEGCEQVTIEIRLKEIVAGIVVQGRRQGGSSWFSLVCLTKKGQLVRSGGIPPELGFPVNELGKLSFFEL